MKKILYVTNITRTVNTFFIPHMNMLVNEGHKVDCACKITGEHKLNKYKINKNINFYDIPFTRNPLSYKNIIAFYKLYKIQRNKKYDIIHVHTPIASFYTRLLKLFFKDLNIIYTAHGYHFYKGSSKISWIIFYKLEKFLSKYTDILITINSEDYEISKNFNCKKLINMNGVGVDFSEFTEIDKNKLKRVRKSIGLDEDDFVLIMVGEHNRNKNQIQLIKAIEKIEKENKKIKAIFIGDGELIEENRNYIYRNNIENVKILGFRKDVNDLINISNVLVSMSFREGLPKNIIEGMACKRPIIATKIRGNVDLVTENENGYLVECGDISSTIDVINKMNNLKEHELEKMSNKSYELVQKYNISIILGELKKIY